VISEVKRLVDDVKRLYGYSNTKIADSKPKEEEIGR